MLSLALSSIEIVEAVGKYVRITLPEIHVFCWTSLMLVTAFVIVWIASVEWEYACDQFEKNLLMEYTLTVCIMWGIL